MKRIITYLVFVLSFTQILKGNEVDSLKVLLNNAQNDSQRVHILLQLTNKVRFYDNNEAIDLGRKAYTLAVNIPNDEAKAEALFLLGRLSYSRSEHDSALYYFQQGLQQFKTLKNHAGIGDCLVGIGDYYYFIDEYPIAEDFYLKAIESYKLVNKSTGIANTYISLGDVAYSIDKYIKASQYYQMAFPEYEKANSKLGMATSINCMADIDYELDQFEDARQGYKTALSMFIDINDVLGMANCIQRLGGIHYQQNNYDSSFIYYEKSFELYSKIGSKMGQAYSLRSAGSSYLKLNNPAKAIKYFNKAHKLFEDTGDKMGIANSHFHFGEAFFMKGDYYKAIERALKGYTFAKDIGSYEITLFTTDLLAKSYAKLNDFENAYKYQGINKQAQDSLNSNENIRKITQLQMQFQFDQETKEKEVATLKKDLLQDAELKQQKIYTSVGIICGVLTLLIAFVFYRSFKQKQKSNILLEGKNEIIASKNKDLTDSIEYALTLQKAILPQHRILYDNFPDSFIFYNPKDIVSGDFHWFTRYQNHFIVTASDCTGHGVPGAFMSLLGNEFLHQVVNNEHQTDPKETILLLDKKIKDALHVHEKHKRAKDGMDLALCSINMETLELSFCGAYNPLYLIRNEKIELFTANKGSVGSLISENLISHKIKLQKNDIIYMFSDGYLDQFGGPKGKKFMKKRFQKLLVENCNHTMENQKKLLHQNIVKWQGDYKQVDDMLVIGIKI